ncbi:ABC-F family ATP-binding cassette domain-containing protein [Lederbergia galactosidilytica]|uniref:Multidrug ABC transporter ATP-binding protein n=1 Tax=Lederbergia galactosidilytica TaxID=217031 RepID=A0A0Q9YEY2_9BACI|nr:ABC-F family ATP-binding cassette domain-containing protein [Lederbergia galactosidilytica]KRG12461.1 multidrug ABC transporter ATP-binding protein [Virgibacillus soli]KRG16266.1 multidrug ABC transporter ATP-binding protein [Lederbergia galactosidilytica]MBP1916656.1 ATP-binding cassette subfamily F protein uup [Lederbergia galactosidilytica]OAK69824.1 multidrug ABC transporter ATP-binding protein [Lederbergia galactosidilytica]
MNIFSAENVSKTYGEKRLFEDITFHIEEKEKIGIIGINGTGKSSLLKLIAGLDDQDSGTFDHPKDYSIAYLSQDPEMKGDLTVLDQVFQSKAPEIQLMNAYEHTLIQLEQDPQNSQLQKKILELQKRMDAENGWIANTNAKTILMQLGIQDLTQSIASLSGGQKKRVALAQVLIERPDLLLLDEPTNHLDYESIIWLESYLNNSPNAVLTVTHDRYFLDQVATRIFEIDHGRLFSYKGNYASFLEAKALREEQEAQEAGKKKNLYRQELAWMRQGAKARSTKQKARIQRFEKLEQEMAKTNSSEELNLTLGGSRLGKQVFELKAASKVYSHKIILDDFQLLVNRGDRIGIVGKNGSGKSTLLNILAGQTTLDNGALIVGQTVKIAYYTQEIEQPSEDQRMIAYIREEGETIETKNGEVISATQMLERFLFPTHMHGTWISRLSGGERRRLFLLKLLMGKPNVLLLDEPTNDLDTETLTVLENYIDEFPGVVISVSHDRYFLDKTADKLLIFQGNGKIDTFIGTYTEYLQHSRNRDKEEKRKQTTEKQAEKHHAKMDIKRENQKKKMTYKEKMEWETIEETIMEIEELIEQMQSELDEVGSNYQRAEELSSEIDKTNKQLEELIARWTYLSDLAE